MTEPNWIVINIDGPIVECAEVDPSNPDILLKVRTFKAADFATATDCIRRIASELPSQSLHGHKAAIAVSAAITGDTVRISRGTWIISIDGLRHMFGKTPVVVNDSVALSWAGAHFTPQTHKMIGQQSVGNEDSEGRIAVVNWGLGLGGGAIHESASGNQISVPCEFGHTGFSPETEREIMLHKLLGRGKNFVSWEQVLCLSRSDEIWRDPALGMAHVDIEPMLAELAGAFASNVVLSLTAWKGLVFTGSKAAIVEKEIYAQSFLQRFQSKSAYKLKMRTVPCWTFNNPNAALMGCARILAVHR